MAEKLPNEVTVADKNSYVNENILKSCHKIYSDKDAGMIKIGSMTGFPLLAPRKKITVMLMGNHSAGKSAFINWYINENVQKTGVAVETQGFTFVTKGKRRETLTANATFHLYPNFQFLQEIEGLAQFISTEVSPSRARDFPLITFIDTPGLVDGDGKYPFDVETALLCLGEQCDLILTFFDPMGQALCTRTLAIVEQLQLRHPDRMRLFLSKADTVDSEADRQKVLMQIVQELCRRQCFGRTGFDMPTIYIPGKAQSISCPNHLPQLCAAISSTIEKTVQTTLNQLDTDTGNMAAYVDTALTADDAARKHNKTALYRSLSLSLVGFIFPLVLVVICTLANAPVHILHDVILGAELTRYLTDQLRTPIAFWVGLGANHQLTTLGVSLGISSVFLLLSRVYGEKKPTLHQDNRRELLRQREGLECAREKKKQMYAEYLQQSVSDQDI